MTAAPSVRHQRASGRLERALYRLLEDPVLAEVELAEAFARER